MVALLLAVAFAPVMGHQLDTTLQVSRLFSPACVGLSLLLIVVIGTLSGIIPGLITSRVKPIEIIKGTFVHQTCQRTVGLQQGQYPCDIDFQ